METKVWKYRIESRGGILYTHPQVSYIYDAIASEVANNMVVHGYIESWSKEWHTLYLDTVIILESYAQQIQYGIVQEMNYSMSMSVPNKEHIINTTIMSHADALHYINWYNDALNIFRSIFNNIDKRLRENIKKILPFDESK